MYLNQGGTMRQTNTASMQPLLPGNLCMTQPTGYNMAPMAPLYGQPSMQLQTLPNSIPNDYQEEYRTDFPPTFQPMYDAGQTSYMPYNAHVDQRFQQLPVQPEYQCEPKPVGYESGYASMPRNANTLKPLKPILKTNKGPPSAHTHSSTLTLGHVQPWQCQVAGSLRKPPPACPAGGPHHAHHAPAASSHNPVIEVSSQND